MAAANMNVSVNYPLRYLELSDKDFNRKVYGPFVSKIVDLKTMTPFLEELGVDVAFHAEIFGAWISCLHDHKVFTDGKGPEEDPDDDQRSYVRIILETDENLNRAIWARRLDYVFVVFIPYDGPEKYNKKDAESLITNDTKTFRFGREEDVKTFPSRETAEEHALRLRHWRSGSLTVVQHSMYGWKYEKVNDEGLEKTTVVGIMEMRLGFLPEKRGVSAGYQDE
jgi:hypothetical protein